MRLHVRELGSGPRMILLHGFTQTGASWGRLAEALATDHTVVLPDLPGHGGSSAVRADLPEAADLLAKACGAGTWVGYSMGGRHALHVATRHPETVQRLVVLGATAGIIDPLERADRRAHDEKLADRIERIGVDTFLKEWLAQPLFAGLPADPDGLALRRANTADGLAASLRLAGTGTQVPLDAALGSLEVPVLVVAGERDVKFRAEADRLVAAIGTNATAAVVHDAGHAAHTECPDAFLTLLRTWLNSRSAE